ncbi:MAG TPA: GNAT family N-acetyltransferase [Eubacteriaceae bacterium]|nr:GNAT family N-acetyltransferase [Eubacteriaceae bacterium]
MDYSIKPCQKKHLHQVLELWNQVVEEGQSFPQIESLSAEEGARFFFEQNDTVVAASDEKVLGFYILHPNNVGRCAHIANTSYAVQKEWRNKGVGRRLVKDSLERARTKGYRIMQFNAVVLQNKGAIKIYEELGFHPLGVVPKGFFVKDYGYEDILLYYKELEEV